MDAKDQLDRLCEEADIAYSQEIKEHLHTIKRRKADWIAYMLRGTCLLKYVVESKREGKGIRGKRRKQLLGDLREKITFLILKRTH
jgi:hypothetical protein